MAEDFHIQICNVTKKYGEGEGLTYALNDVSLSIRRGEFVTIIGESGSGKSTLLNMLGAIDFPSNGKIIVNGRDITKFKEKELTQYRKNEVGFVYQFFYLVTDITALQNVMLVNGYKHKEQAEKLLDKVGLLEKKDKFPRQLSGGQQQRVAIARALNKEGDLLLLDEPTGALDEASGIKILELIQTIHDEGKTIILVTHTKEIGLISDRIIKMKDGKIVSDQINEHPLPVHEVHW
ncbi:MAG: ABC transporter ATP-binding protein [Bacilli bacterium]|jgi:putative ABC transport system ATP-binding protein|nr:ABC transporter ATP-binding protein [Bacilli bacterium]